MESDQPPVAFTADYVRIITIVKDYYPSKTITVVMELFLNRLVLIPVRWLVV